MKMRRWILGAAAAAVAALAIACGNGGNGGPGAPPPDWNPPAGSVPGIVFDLQEWLAGKDLGAALPVDVPAGAPGTAIIGGFFANSPLTRAGHTAVTVVDAGSGLRGLQVATPDENWQGIDILLRGGAEALLPPPRLLIGDEITIAIADVTPATNRLALRFGQGETVFGAEEPFPAGNVASHTFDPLTLDDINTMISTAGPDGLRIRGTATGGFTLTGLTIRGYRPVGAEGFDPDYQIDLTAPGIFEGVFTFDPEAVGYEAGDLTALTATVENIGRGATGELAVAFHGAAAGAFRVNGEPTATMPSIAVGASATFSILPALELPIGVHAATVRVTGANGIYASFGVSFEVAGAMVEAEAVRVSEDGTPVTSSNITRGGDPVEFTAELYHSDPAYEPTGSVNWRFAASAAGALLDHPPEGATLVADPTNAFAATLTAGPGVTAATLYVRAYSTHFPAVFGTVAVTVAIPPPEEIDISPAAANIDFYRGATQQFSATVYPPGAVQTVNWTVTGANVPSPSPISTDGLLTVPAAGIPADSVWTVTATSTADSSVYEDQQVTIRVPAATGVSIASPTTRAVLPGASVEFVASVLPAGADQAFAWAITSGASYVESSAGTDTSTFTVNLESAAPLGAQVAITVTAGTHTATATINVGQELRDFLEVPAAIGDAAWGGTVIAAANNVRTVGPLRVIDGGQPDMAWVVEGGYMGLRVNIDQAGHHGLVIDPAILGLQVDDVLRANLRLPAGADGSIRVNNQAWLSPNPIDTAIDGATLALDVPLVAGLVGANLIRIQVTDAAATPWFIVEDIEIYRPAPPPEPLTVNITAVSQLSLGGAAVMYAEGTDGVAITLGPTFSIIGFDFPAGWDAFPNVSVVIDSAENLGTGNMNLDMRNGTAMDSSSPSLSWWPNIPAGGITLTRAADQFTNNGVGMQLNDGGGNSANWRITISRIVFHYGSAPPAP